MKKKMLTVVLALVITFATVFGVSTSAFAYSKAATISSATDSTGASVTATFTLDQRVDLDMVGKFWEVTKEQQATIQAYYGYNELATSVYANGTLDLTGSGASAENPVTLTFSMADEYGEGYGVKAGCKWLYVFQQFTDGTYKVLQAQSTANGTATAQFTDAVASKILIVELDLAREGLYTDEDMAALGISALSVVAEVGGVSSATDATGASVNVTVAPLSDDMKRIAETQAYDLFQYKGAFAAADVNLEGTNVSADNPITVTFSIAGVNAGDEIVVLHKKSDGSWEKLTGTAGSGTVTATFTSFSPVLFVRTSAAPATSAPTTSAPQKDKVPNTGDANMTVFWMMIAVCSGAGMVCMYKRKKSTVK